MCLWLGGSKCKLLWSCARTVPSLSACRLGTAGGLSALRYIRTSPPVSIRCITDQLATLHRTCIPSIGIPRFTPIYLHDSHSLCGVFP
ncbi:hypothetical protein DFH09DRAFT_388212 [Mycena vulgaris]|nr:hypothetical protein DFH09DRAFT_653406 [Mycena vulgaris]KAJ6573409.1 hypothetical protein DFH09DRAFT_388212 [Mycena vulgaris]